MTGAMYAGAVYNLQAGDVITLDAARYPSSGAKVYMYSMHTYFGAFLLWAYIFRLSKTVG